MARHIYTIPSWVYGWLLLLGQTKNLWHLLQYTDEIHINYIGRYYIMYHRLLRYERVYLPLCKVADTPFHIQGGVKFLNNHTSGSLSCFSWNDSLSAATSSFMLRFIWSSAVFCLSSCSTRTCLSCSLPITASRTSSLSLLVSARCWRISLLTQSNLLCDIWIQPNVNRSTVQLYHNRWHTLSSSIYTSQVLLDS